MSTSCLVGFRGLIRGTWVGLRSGVMLPGFLCALVVGALMVGIFAVPASADAIDDAAKLPTEDAIVALEALLDDALEEQEASDLVRLHAWLGTLRLQAKQFYAALQNLEYLASKRGEGADRVSYGETLILVARRNMQSRSTAAGVVPYLQDALAAMAPCTDPKSELPAALLLRCALARGEALYILRRYDEAIAAVSGLNVAGQSLDAADRILDLLARARYAAGRFEEAATAYLALSNDLGAAAAYDAAKKPEKSVPLYMRLLKARPADAGLLSRALQGARYAGGEALLLAGLSELPVPEGAGGVALLLTRADLLEATGQTAAAVQPLREASSRDKLDSRPPARLGRVLLLTGDVESEETWNQAAAAYEEALRREPESEAASGGLFYIAGRDYRLLWKRWRDPVLRARCLGVQKALAEARPDDALALSNLGNTLRVLGRLEEACEAYARARAANPYDPSVRSDQGLALSATGRTEEALAAYLESVEMDSGHRAGRQNAARALWLKGEDERAADQLSAAIPSARAVGRSAGTYVFLLGRTWRTTRVPNLR